MHNAYRGFTLIELMITVAILAIILSLAAPSFTRTIADARVAAQTNEFVTAVNVARAEAVRTGATVWLTAKGGSFQNGWCVRTSADACGTASPTDLLDHPALDAGVVLSYPSGTETTSFAFNRLGALVTVGDATTLQIAPTSCSTGQIRRRIGINAIGRISVERNAC